MPNHPYIHLSVSPPTSPCVYPLIYPLTHVRILPSTGYNPSFNLSIHFFYPSAFPFSYSVSTQLPPIHLFLFIPFILSSYGFIHMYTHSLPYLLTCYFCNLNICSRVHPHTQSRIHLSNILYSVRNPSTYLVCSSVYPPSHLSLHFSLHPYYLLSINVIVHFLRYLCFNVFDLFTHLFSCTLCHPLALHRIISPQNSCPNLAGLCLEPGLPE